MKKAVMAMTMMFALGCFAQTSGSSSSNSSMSSSGQSSSSGSMSNGQSGATQNGSMDDNSMNSGMKGEKTLKGCIQSQNGGYALEEKGGTMAMLTSSQDLSAHVGHMVKVHGMWQNGAMNSSSTSSNPSNNGSTDNSGSMATSSNNGSANSGAMNNSTMGKMDHGGQTFMVDKLDMVSDQCKMDKNMSH